MTTVAEILAQKPGRTYAVAPTNTVLEATNVMNEARIGSVLVVERGRVVGILTERDLLTRVLVEERDPRSSRVCDVMTRDVYFCTPATPIDHLRAVMRERRIRHIPVRDEHDALVGLVSIGDLNAFESQVMSATITTLNEYITRA